MRKAFIECPTRMMRRYVENLAPLEARVDLHFGACFAKGIEAARCCFYEEEGYDSHAAMEVGIEAAIQAYGDFVSPSTSYKTKARLVSAIRFYFEQWPLGEDGLEPVEDGIEKSFAITLPLFNPDTGANLLYAGRYDMLATDANGRYYVVDEKTASRLGDTWHLQWDMDSQITGYIWATHIQASEPIEVMAQIRAVAILKNDYGHAEVPITRNKWMLERWYRQMLRDVERMIASYQAGEWDMALGPACSSYNRVCEYAQLCKSPNPERLIEGNYKVVVWNPLERGK
jgi:hypothetical protein